MSNKLCAIEYGIKDINNYDTIELSINPVECRNILTQGMLHTENTKYVIKWNYDLDGATITVPEDCLIEFDGGSFSNGTLVGQDTILIYYQEQAKVLKDVVLSGEYTTYNQKETNTHEEEDTPNEDDVTPTPAPDDEEGDEGDYYPKQDNIILEEDGIYQIKDNVVYPVSHPDLSTQPSVLPQRYGNLPIKEVLIAAGRENEIPTSVIVLEAFSFNESACAPATCNKTQTGWSITNSADITPTFTLVRYAEVGNGNGDNGGNNGGGGNNENPYQYYT